MRSGGFTPVAHAFNKFNTLYRADGALEIESNPSEPYAIAAKDGETTRLLVSNYRKAASSFKLEMPGMKMEISSLSDAGFGKVLDATDEITLPLSAYTVYYIEAVPAK